MQLHIAAKLDINECDLYLMTILGSAKEKYFHVLYNAAVHESIKMDSLLESQQEDITVVFCLFESKYRKN